MQRRFYPPNFAQARSSLASSTLFLRPTLRRQSLFPCSVMAADDAAAAAEALAAVLAAEDGPTGFTATTSDTCPHVTAARQQAPPLPAAFADLTCGSDGCDSADVCVCAHCHVVLCSRAAAGHMLQHAEGVCACVCLSVSGVCLRFVAACLMVAVRCGAMCLLQRCPATPWS